MRPWIDIGWSPPAERIDNSLEAVHAVAAGRQLERIVTVTGEVGQAHNAKVQMVPSGTPGVSGLADLRSGGNDLSDSGRDLRHMGVVRHESLSVFPAADLVLDVDFGLLVGAAGGEHRHVAPARAPHDAIGNGLDWLACRHWPVVCGFAGDDVATGWLGRGLIRALGRRPGPVLLLSFAIDRVSQRMQRVRRLPEFGNVEPVTVHVVVEAA